MTQANMLIYAKNRQKTIDCPIDREAFINLIQGNKVSFYRLAKSILKNEHEVEDAIGETILRAFENLHRLKSQDSFKPWIMKILVNVCYSILKKNKRVELHENIEAFELTYEDNQNELIWTINKLDKDFKNVLILFYYEDLSIKDISSILHISQGTVKSRLSRAKAKLKTMLEGIEEGENGEL